MASISIMIVGVVVIIGSFIGAEWLDDNIGESPESLDYDFKDSILIMETLGMIAGGCLFVVGVFKKKP